MRVPEKEDHNMTMQKANPMRESLGGKSNPFGQTITHNHSLDLKTIETDAAAASPTQP